MTDFDMDDFNARYAIHQQSVAKANEMNKTVLFDALAAAGITSVIVNFDGAGDSGQIDSVDAYANDTLVDLPKTSVSIQHVSWGAGEFTTRDTDLAEAVEDVCYGYLQQEHGGWENNDGAYGQFTLTVSERKVELDFNARFTDSTHYSHTF